MLAQLRRDHRTVAMLIVLPALLVSLMWWMFIDSPATFDRVGGPLLAVFPSIIMFVVTSVGDPAGTLRRHAVATVHDADGASSTSCSATRWRSR